MLGFGSCVFACISDGRERIDNLSGADDLTATLPNQGDQTTMMAGRFPHFPSLVAAQDQSDPWLMNDQSLHALSLSAVGISDAARFAVKPSLR